MQVPRIRSSPDSTAAVTKSAKSMFVMKRPRLFRPESACHTPYARDTAPLGSEAIG